MEKDFFRLKENGTNWRTEVLAGVTTFATMAYIIFVQRVVLSAAGMDAGVAAGGRTGLAALVTAGLFLAALFFSPIVYAISGGYAVSETIVMQGQRVAHPFVLYPVTAPALIVVGSLMIRAVRDIAWDDVTEALPAFLTLVVMPLTFSITDGIAFGFIAYALLKLVTGRAREAHWLFYLCAVLFVLRYALL